MSASEDFPCARYVAAKFFHKSHFWLHPKDAKLEAREAAERDIVLPQEIPDPLVAQFVNLLALVAVPHGPNLDVLGAGLANLGQDFVKAGLSIHARGKNVA